MKQKEYMSIKRVDEKVMDGFRKGDHIIVQEKIDGANFCIRYDAETDSVMTFSRHNPLDAENTLRGAWDWAQTLEKEQIKAVLGNTYALFGEWLVPHSIKYPEEQYQKAFFFDIYDVEEEKYLHQHQVKAIVEQLGLQYVPVFFEGAFESWEQINAFVGQTALGGELGEGVVVKNMDRLNDYKNKRPFYTKVVAAQFDEKRPMKKLTKEQMQKKQQKRQAEMQRKEAKRGLVESIVTEARVTKLLHKMVDEGILPENWNAEHMPIIKKNISSAVYYDCLKEEAEIMEQVGKDFGGIAHSIANEIIGKLLKER